MTIGYTEATRLVKFQKCSYPFTNLYYTPSLSQKILTDLRAAVLSALVSPGVSLPFNVYLDRRLSCRLRILHFNSIPGFACRPRKCAQSRGIWHYSARNVLHLLLWSLCINRATHAWLSGRGLLILRPIWNPRSVLMVHEYVFSQKLLGDIWSVGVQGLKGSGVIDGFRCQILSLVLLCPDTWNPPL